MIHRVYASSLNRGEDQDGIGKIIQEDQMCTH